MSMCANDEHMQLSHLDWRELFLLEGGQLGLGLALRSGVYNPAQVL